MRVQLSNTIVITAARLPGKNSDTSHSELMMSNFIFNAIFDFLAADTSELTAIDCALDCSCDREDFKCINKQDKWITQSTVVKADNQSRQGLFAGLSKWVDPHQSSFPDGKFPHFC